MQSKKLLITLILLTLIIAISIIFFFDLPNFKETQNIAPAAITAESSPGGNIQVSAMRIKPTNFIRKIELPARTNAFKTAQIRPQITGIIQKRLFTEGALVKQNDALYKIDSAIYEAALQTAKAELQRSQAALKALKSKNERYTKLIELNAVSRQEYEDIETGLAEAEADAALYAAGVKEAEIALQYTDVLAPIDGIIGKSNFTEGALVTANQPQPLATITQYDPIYVDITQPAEQLLYLKNHFDDFTQIPITISYGSENIIYPYQGKLQFHEVNVEQTTSSVQIRALFDNPEHILLPGLFVKAFLEIEYKNVISLPQKIASLNSKGGLDIWLVKDGKAVARQIAKAVAVDNIWMIQDGLQENDIIITDNLTMLRDGMNIDVTLINADKD